MFSYKINIILVVVALAFAAVQLAESGTLGDMATSFFQSNRVTRCPVPGTEHEFTDKITIKIMNFPKEPCMKLCQDKGLVSIVGSEMASFGPKLHCCCKSETDNN